MFRGLSSRKFYSTFKCEDDCCEYLFNIKWKNGFVCKRCAHQKAWKGRTAFHRRCRNCNYDESVTANTAFHKIKLLLLKVFGLTFQIVTLKKGRASNDLKKDFVVNEKSVLAFRKTVQTVIESMFGDDGAITNETNLVMDSISLNGRRKDLNGFQRINVNLKEIEDSLTKKKLIQAQCSLPHEEGKEISHLISGQYKDEGASLLMWRIKTWFTGIHQQCSVPRLKGYPAEFLFKHTFRNAEDVTWHLLIEQFIKFNPQIHRNNEV